MLVDTHNMFLAFLLEDTDTFERILLLVIKKDSKIHVARQIIYNLFVTFSGGMLQILSLCIFLPCIFSEEVMPGNGKFWYFAYGSNLLDKRIHINNPSAVREIHAKLEV